MDRIKRFVVLPLGLLIINLALSLYRNPWRSFFNYRLDFWQKFGYFLRGLSACAVYIFLIGLLFTFVFTRVRVLELFKKHALKAMGTVLAAELAARLLADVLSRLFNDAALEAIKRGAEWIWWYSVFLSLPERAIHIAVLYFTLRLLMKPLNLSFTLRKRALFDTLFIYVSVNILSLYLMMRLTEYLNKAGTFTMTSVSLFGAVMNIDGFNALIMFSSGLVSVLLDLLIFKYFRRCSKDSVEAAPIQDLSIH
jgi:hypothetical protein